MERDDRKTSAVVGGGNSIRIAAAVFVDFLESSAKRDACQEQDQDDPDDPGGAIAAAALPGTGLVIVSIVHRDPPVTVARIN
jgi:hypothetical protein